MAREFASGVRFAVVATLPAAAANEGVVLEQGGKLWFSNGSAWVDLGAAGGGGGGSVDWIIATTGQTLADDVPVLAVITTSQTFGVPATVTPGQTFVLGNSPASGAATLATFDPGAARQIAYGSGQVLPVGETVTLARGETISVVARTATVFDLQTPGAVGPAGPAGSATPAGTSGQVQFNSAGALGGAALTSVDAGGRIIHGGHYDVADISNPAAPAAGFLRMFARAQARRMLPAFVGPSGIDSNLQPALFRNSVYMWLPGTGTTASINWGTSWTARNAGTGAAQAHPTKASTNALTSINRATFSTGTTATGSSGIQSGATVCWRGNAAGLGGFFYFSRFAVETFRADIQVLVGLSALNAALAGEPSAQANTLAIVKDAADTAWNFVSRNASTATKIPFTVPLTVAAGTILDFMMFAPPNSSSVFVRVVNTITDEVYMDDVEVTLTLPVNTTFLFAHAQIRSTTGTTAALLALNRIYVETDQ